MTTADTSLEELQKQLKREEGAVVGGRGLIADAKDEKTKDCQTFEVFFDANTGENTSARESPYRWTNRRIFSYVVC